MRDCFVSDIALWDSNQSANVADIYNSGITHDLSLLASAPTHYYRMGDGDTFPILQDSVGSLDLTMFNMTDADIVNDAP